MLLSGVRRQATRTVAQPVRRFLILVEIDTSGVRKARIEPGRDNRLSFI